MGAWEAQRLAGPAVVEDPVADFAAVCSVEPEGLGPTLEFGLLIAEEGGSGKLRGYVAGVAR